MTITPPEDPTTPATPAQTPAGWYPDGTVGRNRYWDGNQWTDQYQPVANVTFTDVTPKSGNGLGIASMIVGIVAIVFGIIPILSFIAWLPAVVGIGLAIGGLIIKNRKRGTAIVGLILNILAIIIGIIVTVASIAGVSSAIVETQKTESAKAAVLVDVVYEVTSDSPTGSVTYSTYTDGSSGTSSANDTTLPFTKSFQVKTGGTFDFTSLSVSGIGSATATTISCKITYAGKVIAEQTSTGAYASVFCNGTPK